MSRNALYVTDGLLYNGRAYDRGDEIAIESDALRDQLLESGQVSTTKPSPAVAIAVGDDGGAVTVIDKPISDFSDEELLAEATERGLIDQGKVDYAELTIDELKDLCEQRELEVTRGDGKKGNPVQADYVAALEAADTSSSDD